MVFDVFAEVIGNTTFNATGMNETATVLQTNLNNFWWGLIERFFDIVTAPMQHKEMLWIITPMILTIILMELYFGRYRREELGWNSAVANSLVLVFVSVDLLRRVYGDDGFISFITQDLFSSPDIPLRTLIALALIGYGTMLLLFNFFHIFPKKFAFFISSSLPVNFIAYMAIVVIYSDLPLIEADGYLTLIASFLFLLLLYVFFTLIQTFEPKSGDV